MEPTFDPRDYFELAKELTEQNANEARVPTAINRAYYALFWLARKKAGTREKRGEHAKVVSRLRKMPGLRAAADQLDTLRRLRELADY
ncbi:MAG: hypothetical protein HY782_15870 [Chloroflexi bacterium]|nr:hypothetical protein [Chloroflexota bacterium]